MIDNLSPKEAWQFLQDHADAVLIDVRTQSEYTDIGHPIGAIFIPWMEHFGAPINPNFIAEIYKQVPNTNTPILLLCRSGQRSLAAAQVLEQVGYTHLINILEGYEGIPDANQQRGNINGWKFHGLP